MTMICLIRHGETNWNALGKLQGQTDVPLNAKGIQQARDCGAFLKNFEWDAIISSPLSRAKDTAERINQELHLNHMIMEEFKERSFGQAEGMTQTEREDAFPDKNYPDQEADSNFLYRLMNGLSFIQDQFPNQNVVLVTHGAVIHTLLDHLSNGTISKKQFKLFNGGLNHIQFDQYEWKVKAYNQISHLT